MCNTNTSKQRLCCVCDVPLYGRSDKVFCGIRCKNKYHSDVRRHTKTAASVSTKILYKNYQLFSLLLGDNCDRFTIKKLELKKMGFDFDTISAVSATPYGLKFEVFEYSWYYSKNNNIIVMQDKNQSKVSPFMYKRWQRTLRPLQTDILPGQDEIKKATRREWPSRLYL